MINDINPHDYRQFLSRIRETIRHKQLEAYRKANKTMLELYWQLGQQIVENLEEFRWGKSVVKNLSRDLQRDFPGVCGFSVQNLWRMRNFYLAYAQNQRILPLLGDVGWTHHVMILDKTKDDLAREYYMRAVRKYGWTADVLAHKISSGDFERFALAHTNNFDQTLPEAIRNQAKLSVKDHYLFDFLEMGDEYSERQLEDGLIAHLQQFIQELGHGEFAFLGRQFKITVEDEEFFIDLLFFHRTLRSLVALELKIGKFEPEYSGKMNFYLQALDMHVRKKEENPSIGIILCREKKKTIVEYSFSNIEKPMGVATYGSGLPDAYKGLLPSPEEISQRLEAWDERLASMPETITATSKIITHQPPDKDAGISARQTRFLQSARPGSRINSEQYARQMNVSISTASRDLTDMTNKNYMQKSGKRRNVSYVIIKTSVEK